MTPPATEDDATHGGACIPHPSKETQSSKAQVQLPLTPQPPPGAIIYPLSVTGQLSVAKTRMDVREGANDACRSGISKQETEGLQGRTQTAFISGHKSEEKINLCKGNLGRNDAKWNLFRERKAL